MKTGENSTCQILYSKLIIIDQFSSCVDLLLGVLLEVFFKNFNFFSETY